jgi:ABC-type multidrug transport system fused ATPase/permease subunit
MESSILKFVFRHSLKEQMLLLAWTLLAFPFLYLSLDLPKIIVNEAIGGTDFPRLVLGRELEQGQFLVLLSCAFLMLVLVNGAFKYFLNVYRGVVGERMLRRLRYMLFQRVLRFPLPQFRKVSQGEIVSMITAETEPLGGFIGDAVALPAFQGGTAITILVFMFVQDWKLGLAAISLYPLQAWLIPKLQRRVNALKKQRVMHVRRLSESLGETVSGIRDVYTHDTARLELADFTRRAGEIYHVRLQIYVQKFLIKFVNNFLAQVTPFFFYSIGGYLVIIGDLSFGALVAILAAYKDLSDPWKELLKFYEIKEDARVKYELLHDMFEAKGLLREELLCGDAGEDQPLVGQLVASNLTLADEDESGSGFDGTFSARIELPRHVALLGDGSSGRDRVAAIIGGLKRPATGSVVVGGVDIVRAPLAVTGRRIAVVGQSAAVRSGSVRDNLLYGLKHRPLGAPGDEDEAARAARAVRLREAHQAGNSTDDPSAEWLDYEMAGLSGPEALTERVVAVLRIVDLDDDVYQLGLQGAVEPAVNPAFAARILEARAELRHRLEEREYASLVEPFDEAAFNSNMSVAENLLFGTPKDESLDLEELPDHPYVRKVLDETGLIDDFLVIGRKVAEIMVDLFADVAPDSELFERFSFIATTCPNFAISSPAPPRASTKRWRRAIAGHSSRCRSSWWWRGIASGSSTSASSRASSRHVASLPSGWARADSTWPCSIGRPTTPPSRSRTTSSSADCGMGGRGVRRRSVPSFAR